MQWGLSVYDHCVIQTDLSQRDAVYTWHQCSILVHYTPRHIYCSTCSQAYSAPCTIGNKAILNTVALKLHAHSSPWNFMHTALTFQLAGPPIALQSSYFGRSTGRILTNGAQCNGSELKLTDCQLNSLIGVCDHGHDVGVICHGEFGTSRTLTLQVHCIYIKICTCRKYHACPPKNKNKQRSWMLYKVTDSETFDKCPPVLCKRTWQN